MVFLVLLIRISMVLNTRVHEHEECLPLQRITITGFILNL
jgi:hypothetical protein